MKFFKVFSLVVVGHIFLIGAFLLQPGCQSIDRQWEEYRLEKQNVTVPRAVLAQEQGLPVNSDKVDPSFNSGYSGVGEDGRATRVRSNPTRPVAAAPQAPTEPLFGTEPSEPLFNPGLEGGFNSGAVMEEPSPTSGYVPYTVQSGDTLWGLSKEYNVSFAALLEANGMTRDSQLKVGQEILVPSGYGEVEQVTVGSIEEEVVPGTSIYVVRSGDTLSEIAARAGTSVSRIKNLNNMTSDRIRIGQKLIVPGEITVIEEEVVSVDVDPSEFSAVHKVQSGETVSGIAYRYGMSVTELLAVNGIDDPRRLRAGTELKVKPASSTSKLSSPSSSESILLPARASGS
ncbi:MAG: LysM peptidoglycan-binding domain-containing protein, partial [Puniceicoccales bacterium]